jgi:hypothetical protein
VADAQRCKCDPQTPLFAVAKGPFGQRIRIGADSRWMGLARWNPWRARRTAAAAIPWLDDDYWLWLGDE